MEFMTRLYELRENANLKQTELAQKVSLKSSAIMKFNNPILHPNNILYIALLCLTIMLLHPILFVIQLACSPIF